MFARMIKSFVNTFDNAQRAGLAPARSVYSTLLRNAAVRGLLGALKICPGLPSS
jgi:hypothetical protein